MRAPVILAEAAVVVFAVLVIALVARLTVEMFGLVQLLVRDAAAGFGCAR